METHMATFRDGQIELDEAVNWPNGTRLTVTADEVRSNEKRPMDWPINEEQRAEWVVWLRDLEPFDMDESERSALEENLKTNKEQQKALLRASWGQTS